MADLLTPDPPTEPCGSWRVVRYVGGIIDEERWCDRVDGPCPYAGTHEVHQQKTEQRRCGALPGRVLRATWAPETLERALSQLLAYRVSGDEPSKEAAMVAIDALRECGAGEPT